MSTYIHGSEEIYEGYHGQRPEINFPLELSSDFGVILVEIDDCFGADLFDVQDFLNFCHLCHLGIIALRRERIHTECEMLSSGQECLKAK